MEMNKIAQALTELIKLIESGKEFPDAQWTVTQTFKLNTKEVQAVVDGYDAS